MMKQQKITVPLRVRMMLAAGLFSLSAMAQQVAVKGHVKDSTGEPVIGATITVGGKPVGVTDFDGNFTIQAEKGAQVQVSYIGYQTYTAAAGDNMVITMQDDATTLDQVVVIGYGVAKKNDLTGSVTAIKPDEKNHGLQVTAQDMIQGKIAGVNVVNNGGEPGGGATIRVRGGSSLNASNDPLIVIDGLAMDNYGAQGLSNPLSMVNPADIESFTVLKDASATAIYGSRASNGVIIITTKKGRKNQRPRITYNGNVSVSLVANKLDVMNSSEYIKFAQKTLGMDDATFLASDEYKTLGYYDADGNHLFADTDWQDEIFRTTVSTDHNITIAGGYKNLPYRVSVGYTNQQGVVKTSDFERYTGSINLSPSLLDDHLTMNLNAKGMLSTTNYSNDTAIRAATSMDPTKPVYGATDYYKNHFGGYWQWSQNVDRDDTQWTEGYNTLATANPVAYLNGSTNRGKTRILIGNAEFDYKIHGFEDLHLHANLGMDLTHGKSESSQATWSRDNYYYGNAGWSTQDSYNLSLNVYAQYLKELNKSNRFDIMAGYEWQHFHRENDYFYQGLYPTTYGSKSGNADNLALAGTAYQPSENTLYKTENYLVSFFGRLNYSLLDRYLFTFTLRNDGSSRFSDGNRWGLFPSAAFAWKINEEAFMKNADAVSDFKLRAGYGITGQQEGIGDYTYFATYTTNNKGAYYPVYGDGTTYRPDAYNGELTWEKTTTYNVGLDLGLFNNRFTASLDYYYRKTKDLINTVYVPAGSNFKNRVTSNIGSLHNQGIELALTWRPIQSGDWNWELNYNVTHNASTIDELAKSTSGRYMILHGGLAVGDGSTDGIKAWTEGEAVSAYYVFQQVYDQNGQPIEGEFVDRDGNGIINNNDRYFYKKSDPVVTMGLSSRLQYKNWDLGLSFRSSLGNYAYNAVEANSSNVSSTGVYSGKAWHNVPTMSIAKNWQTVSNRDAVSDYFIQNASFLKLDNVTVGYSFDKLFGANISGRVYATAQNVFTITKYKGIDPEINGGYDNSIYPRPFTGIFGLNLNF